MLQSVNAVNHVLQALLYYKLTPSSTEAFCSVRPTEQDMVTVASVLTLYQCFSQHSNCRVGHPVWIEVNKSLHQRSGLGFNC